MCQEEIFAGFEKYKMPVLCRRWNLKVGMCYWIHPLKTPALHEVNKCERNKGTLHENGARWVCCFCCSKTGSWGWPFTGWNLSTCRYVLTGECFLISWKFLCNLFRCWIVHNSMCLNFDIKNYIQLDWLLWEVWREYKK